MKVTVVGLGSTNISGVGAIGTLPIVEVERGFVGSSATSHSQFSPVSIYRGSYNIVDSKIYFTEAPIGAGREDLDSRGLAIPRSNFSGRVYLRKDYGTNLLFDDVSDQFDGVTSDFTLSSNGNSVTGIGSTGGNGVVFINGVFQAPSTPNNTYSLVLFLLVVLKLLILMTLTKTNFLEVEFLFLLDLPMDWDMLLSEKQQLFLQ
jgi:hypothetical protein